MVPAEQQWDGPEYDGASIKAQTCRRHVKTRAGETEKHQTHSAEVGIPHSAEDGAARRLSRKAPTKPWQNSGACVDGHRAAVQERKRDWTQVVLPRTTTTLVVLKASYTRERKRAQTADRVVVKYLDRKARAPTANRRSRSGVGGARRGVREYGAVNYHKVALEEQRERRTKEEQCQPQAKEEQCQPQAKEEQCQPQAKEEHCQPQAKEEQGQPQAKKRQFSSRLMSSESTRTMSSASSPSTKGGGEKSVIWLRERNKEIEENSIRRRTSSV